MKTVIVDSDLDNNLVIVDGSNKVTIDIDKLKAALNCKDRVGYDHPITESEINALAITSTVGGSAVTLDSTSIKVVEDNGKYSCSLILKSTFPAIPIAGNFDAGFTIRLDIKTLLETVVGHSIDMPFYSYKGGVSLYVSETGNDEEYEAGIITIYPSGDAHEGEMYIGSTQLSRSIIGTAYEKLYVRLGFEYIEAT
jgi:hypothetical protein